MSKYNIDLEELYIKIKLKLNDNLYEKNYITEEMYFKAKQIILNS